MSERQRAMDPQEPEGLNKVDELMDRYEEICNERGPCNNEAVQLMNEILAEMDKIEQENDNV